MPFGSLMGFDRRSSTDDELTFVFENARGELARPCLFFLFFLYYIPYLYLFIFFIE